MGINDLSRFRIDSENGLDILRLMSLTSFNTYAVGQIEVDAEAITQAASDVGKSVAIDIAPGLAAKVHNTVHELLPNIPHVGNARQSLSQQRMALPMHC